MALADFNRALQFVERNSIVYFDRGLVYEQLGDVDNAILDYKNFLELATDGPLRNLAEARLAEIEN